MTKHLTLSQIDIVEQHLDKGAALVAIKSYIAGIYPNDATTEEIVAIISDVYCQQWQKLSAHEKQIVGEAINDLAIVDILSSHD